MKWIKIDNENTILMNCTHYIDIHTYNLIAPNSDYTECSKCGSDNVEENYCRECDNEVHIENFS